MPFNFKVRVHQQNVIDVQTLEFFYTDDVTVSDHEPFWCVATFVETGVAVDGGVGTFCRGDD
jgi:hypothetical protein